MEAGEIELEPAAAALGALLRAHRILVEGVGDEFKEKVGLSFAQWEVLHVLREAPEGRLRMVDITKRMCVSKSNVTQLVDRLEESGLVAREFSRSDRRLTYARLTDAGADATRRGWDAFNAAATKHFARHMSGAEVRSLHRALTKVLGAHEPESVAADNRLT